jgi:hypothetical protein
MGPAFPHTLFVRFVVESDQGDALFFGQPALHIRDPGIGHDQRSGDLDQRRPLDGLYHSPEIAVAIRQIAESPAARPRLEFHRHRPAVRCVITRPDLFQQSGEGRLQISVHF